MLSYRNGKWYLLFIICDMGDLVVPRKAMIFFVIVIVMLSINILLESNLFFETF